MSLKRLLVFTFGSIVVLVIVVSLFASDEKPLSPADGWLQLSPVAPTEEIEGDAAATLLVQNRTTEVICGVLIAKVGEGWSEDWLQSEVVNPGSSKQFSLAPGRYRLRVDNCFEYTLAEVDEVEISGLLEWTIASESMLMPSLPAQSFHRQCKLCSV